MKTFLLLVTLIGIGSHMGRAQVLERQPITMGETLTLSAETLGEERTVRVYVPPSYAQTEQAYPVVYVLDGEVAFFHTASAAQFLARYGTMPEALVVAVHNTNRWRDMPVPDNYGQGDEASFLSFLGDELVPFIEQTYRTQPLRVLMGHSQGGLFAAYAMTQALSPFQWYISMDAPLFGAGEEIKDAIVERVSDKAFARRLVTVDRTLGWKEEWSRVEAAAHPGLIHAQILIERETATHETMTYVGTYRALEALFVDYAPRDITTKNLATLEAEYAHRSAQYGYEIVIPRRLLLRNIDDLLFQMRGEEAQALLDYTVARYGGGDQTNQLQRRVDEVLAEGPLEETVADILNYPTASPEAMAPYLGTWEGQVKDRFPMDAIVTFEVQGGNVQGHTLLASPDGRGMRRIEHVMTRILDDGSLEWGYMNQMRPRGVITYRGRMENGMLRGKMEMRGVKLTPPPGVVMREVFIELRRQE